MPRRSRPPTSSRPNSIDTGSARPRRFQSPSPALRARRLQQRRGRRVLPATAEGAGPARSASATLVVPLSIPSGIASRGGFGQSRTVGSASASRLALQGVDLREVELGAEQPRLEPMRFLEQPARFVEPLLLQPDRAEHGIGDGARLGIGERAAAPVWSASSSRPCWTSAAAASAAPARPSAAASRCCTAAERRTRASDVGQHTACCIA